MMQDDLKTYLASKYMSGAVADAILARSDGMRPKKKKKRLLDDAVTTSTSRGLLIDDDVDDWRNQKGEEEEQAMVVESRQSAGFKPIVPKEAESVPAPDEAPVVVGPVIEEVTPPTKSRKPKGGLRSAAEVAKEAAEAKAARTALEERERRQLEGARRTAGLDDDTIVRGPDGRPIDRKAAAAEEKRRQRAEMEKEMAKMQWGKGLVQREDREKRREEEAAIASQPFSRFADDADLNIQQRDVARWNDPAANFLSARNSGGKSRKEPSRPTYHGSAAPNRFSIRPGYRWDGVDRSNGFEKRLASASNDRKTRNEAMHAWSVEDM